jgi:hypothetical protein
MKSFKNLQSHRLCTEFPTPRRFAILHRETMVLTSEDVWFRGEETSSRPTTRNAVRLSVQCWLSDSWRIAMDCGARGIPTWIISLYPVADYIALAGIVTVAIGG